MSGEKKRKRLCVSSSEEEERQLLNDILSSSEEENLIKPKTRRRMNSLNSSSESETGEQDASQFQDNNGNEFTSPDSLVNICWSHRNLIPKIHNFDDKYSGCKAALDNTSKPLDYFQLFFPESLVNVIVNGTNRYHNYIKKKRAWKAKSRMNSWLDTSLDEVYCFLATLLLMSRIKKRSYPEYWSKDKFLKTDIFHNIMSRDRFLNLMQCLHFSNPEVSNCTDKLFKIRELYNRFRLISKQNFYPFQSISIDEGLLLFKGRLSLKQSVSPECDKFCIKSFLARDCKTGYILDMLVYPNSEREISVFQENLDKSGNVAMSLMRDYLGRGHSLYVNDWCTSPLLFSTLHSYQTNCCGAVRRRAKCMPIIPNKLEKGEISFRSTETLLCMKWKSERETWMLTSLHHADIVETGKLHHCTKAPMAEPTCVQDYNRHTRGADKTDMVISTIESMGRSYKWYKKFLFHLLDISIWNSYVLYKHVSGQHLQFPAFHLLLIKQIFGKYLPTSSTYQGQRVTHDPLRLIERHFPCKYFNPSRKKKNQTRKCVVCTKNKVRRESRYQCKKCNVGLCVDPCFEIYHTQIDY